MPLCWVGMGGNVGDVQRTFSLATELLQSRTGSSPTRTSSVYETIPIGEAAGQKFLNAAIEFEFAGSAPELLVLLQTIETNLGRVRGTFWGPRTLDLDLLLYGELILNSQSLTIPHPNLWFRRFVLDPLAEIAPDLIHPVFQVSISSLLRRLESNRKLCSICGFRINECKELCTRMQRIFPQWEWSIEPTVESMFQFSIDPIESESTRLEKYWIDLCRFPTTPVETIRNVVNSAIDAPKRIN